eukprot:TRINITY_DN16864_c0_g1_i1.p1 TRINITY_DN16864_c0_g1~~TRINITY_DN16864_c0_g1_i1.p1  ORF type:complete len:1010 (+),score=158.20 TRINITY_DN16864_c0_g1_i1:411-3440(+)
MACLALQAQDDLVDAVHELANKLTTGLNQQQALEGFFWSPMGANKIASLAYRGSVLALLEACQEFTSKCKVEGAVALLRVDKSLRTVAEVIQECVTEVLPQLTSRVRTSYLVWTVTEGGLNMEGTIKLFYYSQLLPRFSNKSGRSSEVDDTPSAASLLTLALQVLSSLLRLKSPATLACPKLSDAVRSEIVFIVKTLPSCCSYEATYRSACLAGQRPAFFQAFSSRAAISLLSKTPGTPISSPGSSLPTPATPLIVSTMGSSERLEERTDELASGNASVGMIGGVGPVGASGVAGGESGRDAVETERHQGLPPQASVDSATSFTTDAAEEGWGNPEGDSPFWIQLFEDLLQEAIESGQLCRAWKVGRETPDVSRDLATFGFFAGFAQACRFYLSQHGLDAAALPSIDPWLRFMEGAPVVYYPDLGNLVQYQHFLEVVREAVGWVQFFPGVSLNRMSQEEDRVHKKVHSVTKKGVSKEGAKANAASDTKEGAKANAASEIVERTERGGSAAEGKAEALQGEVLKGAEGGRTPRWQFWRRSPSGSHVNKRKKSGDATCNGHSDKTNKFSYTKADMDDSSINDVSRSSSQISCSECGNDLNVSCNCVNGSATLERRMSDPTAGADESLLKEQRAVLAVHSACARWLLDFMEFGQASHAVTMKRASPLLLAVSFQRLREGFVSLGPSVQQLRSEEQEIRSFLFDAANEKVEGTLLEGMLRPPPMRPVAFWDENDEASFCADDEESTLKAPGYSLLNGKDASPRSAARLLAGEDVSPTKSRRAQAKAALRVPVSALGKIGADAMRGTHLLGSDMVAAAGMLHRGAAGQSLTERERKHLGRALRDMLTVVPIGVILAIPMTPVVHAAILVAIQQWAPFLLPTCFNEGRLSVARELDRIRSQGVGGLPPTCVTPSRADVSCFPSTLETFTSREPIDLLPHPLLLLPPPTVLLPAPVIGLEDSTQTQEASSQVLLASLRIPDVSPRILKGEATTEERKSGLSEALPPVTAVPRLEDG